MKYIKIYENYKSELYYPVDNKNLKECYDYFLKYSTPTLYEVPEGLKMTFYDYLIKYNRDDISDTTIINHSLILTDENIEEYDIIEISLDDALLNIDANKYNI